MGIPRQSKIVFGSGILTGDGREYVSVTLDQAVLAGSRLVAFIGIAGPGHGLNHVFAGSTLGSASELTEIAGVDDVANTVSNDSLFLDFPAGLPQGTTVWFVTNNTGANKIGGWVGEFTDLDETGYGFQGHSYDRNYGYTGTSSSPSCPSPGGNVATLTPEYLFYAIIGTTTVTVTGQEGTLEGYASDAGGFFALQDELVNVENNAQTGFFNLSGSTYWNTFFTGFKTTTLAPPPATTTFVRTSPTIRSQGDPGQIAMQMVTNVAYGTIPTTTVDAYGQGVGGSYGGQTVDITYPVDSKVKLPCAVVVHGGGFMGGTKADTNVAVIADMLARAGYVVFNIDYRTAGLTTRPGGPFVKVADELADYYLFMEWLHANAATYGGDANRVIVIGGSAGGHFALMGAITGGSGHARPSLCIAWSPATQLDATMPTNPVGWPQPVTSGNYDQRAAWALTGNASNGAPSNSAGTANDWQLLSPYWLITNAEKYGTSLGQIPYILIEHEQYDGNVPYSQSSALDSALTARGLSHSLVGPTSGSAASWNGPHAFTALGDFWQNTLTVARAHIGEVRQYPNRVYVTRNPG